MALPPGGQGGRSGGSPPTASLRREADDQDFPPDYYTAPLDLPGKDLLLSTIVTEDRTKKNNEKGRCLFCGLSVKMKPCLMKQHIDEDYAPKNRDCKACEPKPQHVKRHRAIRGEFCRRDWSEMPEQMQDLSKVMKEMATPEHPYSAIKTQYTAFRNACAQKSHDMCDEVAFRAASLSVAPYEWIETWMDQWPDLMWFALRVVCIPCSASAAEHSWSIEGWIHSKRRNRLGQKLVERLVRAHMNMAVDRALDEATKKLLPWDIELVIDEPEGSAGDAEDTIEIDA
jgi:hypothetical protein